MIEPASIISENLHGEQFNQLQYLSELGLNRMIFL